MVNVGLLYLTMTTVFVSSMANFSPLLSAQAREFLPDTVLTRISVTPAPYHLVYAGNNHNVYALPVQAEGIEGTAISIIDTKSDSVIDTIPSEKTFRSGVYAEDSHNLYLSSSDSGSLVIINTNDNIVVDTILGNFYSLVYEPNTHNIYAISGKDIRNSTTGYYIPHSWISWIDQKTNSILGNFTFGDNFRPIVMTYAPSNGMLYIAGEHGRDVVVLDPRSNSIVKTINLSNLTGQYATRVSIGYSPISETVLIYSSTGNAIRVIDTTANKVISEIPVYDEIRSMVYSESNGFMYVGTPYSVVIIDPISNSVVRELDVGQNPGPPIYAEENKRIYVSNWGSYSVSVIPTVGSDGSMTQRPGGTPFTLSAYHNDNTYTINGNSINANVIDIRITPNQSVDVVVTGSSGILELELPKKMIDGIYDVKVARESILFQKIAEDSSSTTIRFRVPDNTDLIQIIGANVVPEFGSLALLVIALSIITVIASSRKMGHAGGYVRERW